MCIVCLEHAWCRRCCCGGGLYCGRECQLAHWPEHKQACLIQKRRRLLAPLLGERGIPKAIIKEIVSSYLGRYDHE